MGRAALGLAMVAVLCTPLSACSGPSCPTVTSRALSDLNDFGTWLTTYGVQGVIGEVGWPHGPDSQQWNDVADAWFGRADELGLGVLAWSAAERWPADYPLAIYRQKSNGDLVVGAQATVLAQHQPSFDGLATAGEQLRGVALAGASFGASWTPSDSYSADNPGTPGVTYTYASPDFLQQLRAHGVRAVRIAVEWERLQPQLGGPLDTAEVGRLRAVIDTAAKLGMASVVDLHNYGRYARGTGAQREVLRVGEPALPPSDLADFWRQLARDLKGERGLVGLGIMNEPHDLPGGATAWEAATRQVVAAIREVDTAVPVLVPGYSWSNVYQWGETHGRPWIQDPHVFYEAHAYFDNHREGLYRSSFEQETQKLAATCTT